MANADNINMAAPNAGMGGMNQTNTTASTASGAESLWLWTSMLKDMSDTMSQIASNPIMTGRAFQRAGQVYEQHILSNARKHIELLKDQYKLTTEQVTQLQNYATKQQTIRTGWMAISGVVAAAGYSVAKFNERIEESAMRLTKTMTVGSVGGVSNMKSFAYDIEKWQAQVGGRYGSKVGEASTQTLSQLQLYLSQRGGLKPEQVQKMSEYLGTYGEATGVQTIPFMKNMIDRYKQYGGKPEAVSGMLDALYKETSKRNRQGEESGVFSKSGLNNAELLHYIGEQAVGLEGSGMGRQGMKAWQASGQLLGAVTQAGGTADTYKLMSRVIANTYKDPASGLGIFSGLKGGDWTTQRTKAFNALEQGRSTDVAIHMGEALKQGRNMYSAAGDVGIKAFEARVGMTKEEIDDIIKISDAIKTSKQSIDKKIQELKLTGSEVTGIGDSAKGFQDQIKNSGSEIDKIVQKVKAGTMDFLKPLGVSDVGKFGGYAISGLSTVGMLTLLARGRYKSAMLMSGLSGIAEKGFGGNISEGTPSGPSGLSQIAETVSTLAMLKMMVTGKPVSNTATTGVFSKLGGVVRRNYGKAAGVGLGLYGLNQAYQHISDPEGNLGDKITGWMGGGLNTLGAASVATGYLAPVGWTMLAGAQALNFANDITKKDGKVPEHWQTKQADITGRRISKWGLAKNEAEQKYNSVMYATGKYVDPFAAPKLGGINIDDYSTTALAEKSKTFKYLRDMDAQNKADRSLLYPTVSEDSQGAEGKSNISGKINIQLLNSFGQGIGDSQDLAVGGGQDNAVTIPVSQGWFTSIGFST